MRPHALVAAILAATTSVAAGAAGRPTLSLDGPWQFRLDPANAGEKEQWFDAKTAFDTTIQVPGAWDAQGFGTETPKLKHNFVGKGWYRRQVTLPAEWAGKGVFLTVGGVHRYAKCWVNGAALGDEHIGYLSPFEREITQHAKPGEAATIAICVDSKQRWDVDTLAGCFDIIDEMFTAWGGIWGHVAIEARGDAWFEDLLVQPRISLPSCLVTAKVTSAVAGGASFRLEILDAEGRVAAKADSPILRSVGFQVEIPQAKLWSPNHPDLYTARLSLVRGEEVLDCVETRFGLRVIEIKGPHILLNGKRTFLHGYGDDGVYPETMAAPSDKAVYLKRLRLIKSYGFNYVRHHSHFLPPEYYDAADEVGMLISPELPIAYQNYYERAKGPALELYRQEWAAVVRRFRNHPSILDWCMGNEMWDGVPLAPDLYRIAKDLDPTRPVIDSNGVGGGGIDGKRDRPTLDFFVHMFDLSHTPLEQPNRHRFGEPKKPVISHEMGNFITFPRLDQIEAFQHNFKPFWLTPAKEKMEKLGLLGEAELWARNSERLYLLCHKLNIEDLRKNPFASGHQWWLFQDYWTGSNGIVDAYFRPKAEIPPERVRPFVGDVVLLLDGLPPVCRGGQALDLKLLVSSYSELSLTGATFVVRASARTNAVAENKGTAQEVKQGTVASLADTAIKLPDTQAPQMLTVEAELSTGDVKTRNEWTAWIYPGKILAPKLTAPIFAGPEVVRALGWLGAKPLPGGEKLPSEAVYVMNQPTAKVLDAVAEGACLVMLAPQGIFPTERNRFKTGWWLGGPGDSNVGTVVYDNPITRAIAPDGWCDIGWHRLVEGSQAVILDNLPSQPEVLVRAIEVHRLCRSKALLFQARLGKGSLIVSGLNLGLTQAERWPEAEWLLARMVENAGTFPKPKGELPLEFLRQRVAAMEPPEGPFLSGFQRIVKSEGETGKWSSFREDDATFHICRQTALGHLVEWETAPLPADGKGATATFVFAGGIGWVEQPRTKGFAFLVNGNEALTFDVTQDRSVWRSADKKVALHFVPMRPMPQDGIGLFYVSVAADLLTPGKPCTFAVRSNSSASRRWFGVNPYTDASGAP